MALVYFGNRAKQAWIPGPRTGMDWSLVRRSNIVQLENGGVYVDDSRAAHREGAPEWEAHPDDLRTIRDFYHGVWGPGPFYWVDPYAVRTNLFSPNFATPGIIADGDWPQIAVGATVPTTLPVGPLGIPSRAIQYSVTNRSIDALPPRRFTILIPPGRKLAFGFHGTVTGTGVVTVRATKFDGTTVTQTYAPLASDGTVSFNTVDAFRYSDGYRIADIFLARTAALGASTVTLNGMRALLLREEDSLPLNDQPFVSGEGSGALSFAGNLRETLIYAPTEDRRSHRKGMGVKLVETGALS